MKIFLQAILVLIVTWIVVSLIIRLVLILFILPNHLDNNTVEKPKVYLNQSTQNTSNEIIIDVNNIDENLKVNNIL